MKTSAIDDLARRWRLWRVKRVITASQAFDARFYLDRNRDVAAAGVDPLEHYILSGDREGRRPNPIFDPAWYLDRYFPGVAEPPNALLDYLRHLGPAPRSPNRWFDPQRYRRAVGSGRMHDPMLHYLAAGIDAHDPSADFDSADIRRRFPDLDRRTTPLGFFLNDYRVVGHIDSCTSHYVSGWATRLAGPPIVVTILVDGREQGRITPWIARPDIDDVLERHALGFFFVFPVRLHTGAAIELRDETGETIIGCATSYRVGALDASTDLYDNRAAIASAYLVGRGVEVGAFTQPTDLPPDREIVFYDRYAADRLRAFYDEGWGRPLMEPRYVGDAQSLSGLPDELFGFLIANHVLEHLEDPILFLKQVAGRLAFGGRAMIAVPDMRFCADSSRVPTSFDHLVADHEHGPERSRLAHYHESALIEGHRGDAAVAYAAAIDPETLLVHYHVWDADGFVAFIRAAIARYALPLTLLYVSATIHEVTVVLERTSGIGSASAA